MAIEVALTACTYQLLFVVSGQQKYEERFEVLREGKSVKLSEVLNLIIRTYEYKIT